MATALIEESVFERIVVHRIEWYRYIFRTEEKVSILKDGRAALAGSSAKRRVRSEGRPAKPLGEPRILRVTRDAKCFELRDEPRLRWRTVNNAQDSRAMVSDVVGLESQIGSDFTLNAKVPSADDWWLDTRAGLTRTTIVSG